MVAFAGERRMGFFLDYEHQVGGEALGALVALRREGDLGPRFPPRLHIHHQRLRVVLQLA